MKSIGFALVIAMLTPIFLFAEGSIDFRNYPGKRLWLDSRDSQQMKVFAAEGEFINVGASHVGIPNTSDRGFIIVYRPDGTMAAIYDTGNGNNATAVIYNDMQELNGPIGTANGGYNPGVVPVDASNEGVWTVVFDFGNYAITTFDTLDNNQAWTRAANQKIGNRVILAWDITVTQGGAGNAGGSPVSGRVFTNEYISILNKNDLRTSPTFYVLSKSGFQYEVDFMDADPFRFPISANSRGLVIPDTTAEGVQIYNPLYRSEQEIDFTRSDDPMSWILGADYLYEPQAEDFGPLINHKLFFNLPDENMPNQALTTDIFRSNTHQTWLFNDIEFLELDSLYFFGANPNGEPCNNPFYEFGRGGYFVTNTNIGGTVNIMIDIDMNGVFDDPIDINLSQRSEGGLDSIFWNGNDGLGNPFAMIGDTFNLSYTGFIRFGEIHIANTDVENNFGGVTFELLNAPTTVTFPTDIFYYDHSDLTAVAGAVSGGGTNGNALPTTIPFTYGNAGAIVPTDNFGNDKYLDQWVFNDFELPLKMLELIVVEECDCIAAQTPVLAIVGDANIEVCFGDMASFSATNTNINIAADILTYNWQGPNGFSFTEGIPGSDTSTVNITSVDQTNDGNYVVVAETANGCKDTATVNLTVNPLPEIVINQAIFSGCAGSDLLITGNVTISGLGLVTYTLTGPNFDFTSLPIAGGVFSIPILGLADNNAGTYTFTVTDDNGCSASATTQVAVNNAPVLANVTGAGSYCEGQNILLSSENTVTGINSITYTWSGPNGFFVQQTTTDVSGPFEAQITAAAAVDSGDYMICLESDQGCGPVCETISVTINSGLEIINITGDGDQCLGQTFTLSAGNSVTAGITTVTYTWTSPDGTMFTDTAPAAGPFDLVVTDPTATAAGTYTLMLEADNGCTSSPVSVNVVINDNPILVPITGGGAYCEGDMVTLTTMNTVAGIGNFTSTWTLPDGTTTMGGSSGTDPFSIVIDNLSPLDTGTYSVTIVSQAGCTSNTVSTQVLLSTLAAVINVTPDTIICDNDELILSATNATMDVISYTWTGPNGYSASGTAAGGATFTESIDPIGTFGPGEYVLTVGAGTCEADPITVNVETKPNPDLAPIFGGGTYCEGDSVTLYTFNTVSGIDSIFYTCIFPNADIVVQMQGGMDTIFITFDSITVADAGILSCAGESTDSCGSSLVTAVINVQATPVIADLSPDTTLCAGQNLTLTATNSAMGTGNATYTWTGPNGFTFTDTAPFGGPFPLDLPNISTDEAGEYCLNITSDGGCMAEEMCTNVTINPTPILTPTEGGGDYCEGDDVTLTTMNTVVGTGDLTYTCTGPNGFMETGTIGEGETIELILANITADQAGVYTCVVETAEGCESNESSATVTVNATPAISDIDGGGPYCEGDLITLTAGNDVPDVGMIEYTWTGPNGFTFTGTANGNGPFIATIPNAELNDAGEYCLNITSMAGCGSDEMCVTIVVNPNPIITDFTGGGEFCEGDVTTLSGIIDLNGTNSVDWTLQGAGLDESGTSTANETISFDINVNEDTDGTYTFTLTSDAGCTATATQTVTLIDVPTPNLEASLAIICPGDELELSVTNDNDFPVNTTFEWFENGVSVGMGNSPAFVVNNAQGGTYSVTATVMGCDESSADITVSVVPAPIAVDDVHEIDFNTTLDDDVTTNDQFGADGVTATLDTEPEFGTVTFNADGTFSYTPDENFAGTDMFTYTICSNDCPDECSSATVIISVVDPECEQIFNVITPNGDGDNDEFFVPCLEGSGPNDPNPNYPTNSLKIFSRWGDVVYTAGPYGNDWGGVNEKGQDLPDGTYFYMIELRAGGGDGDDNLIVGYVTVAR